MSKTTRRVPPSSAKPTGERNKRREGLVKGAPAAQGMFSLSITDRHAGHLPLPMHRLRSRSAPHRKRGKSSVMGIAIIDPVTGRCLIESGVDGCEAGVLPTLANALYGPMDGFSRNPVNVRSLVAITARYLSTTSTTSHLWDSSAGGGAAHSIIADTSQKPAPQVAAEPVQFPWQQLRLRQLTRACRPA